MLFYFDVIKGGAMRLTINANAADLVAKYYAIIKNRTITSNFKKKLDKLCGDTAAQIELMYSEYQKGPADNKDTAVEILREHFTLVKINDNLKNALEELKKNFIPSTFHIDNFRNDFLAGALLFNDFLRNQSDDFFIESLNDQTLTEKEKTEFKKVIQTTEATEAKKTKFNTAHNTQLQNWFSEKYGKNKNTISMQFQDTLLKKWLETGLNLKLDKDADKEKINILFDRYNQLITSVAISAMPISFKTVIMSNSMTCAANELQCSYHVDHVDQKNRPFYKIESSPIITDHNEKIYAKLGTLKYTLNTDYNLMSFNCKDGQLKKLLAGMNYNDEEEEKKRFFDIIKNCELFSDNNCAKKLTKKEKKQYLLKLAIKLNIAKTILPTLNLDDVPCGSKELKYLIENPDVSCVLFKKINHYKIDFSFAFKDKENGLRDFILTIFEHYQITNAQSKFDQMFMKNICTILNVIEENNSPKDFNAKLSDMLCAILSRASRYPDSAIVNALSDAKNSTSYANYDKNKLRKKANANAQYEIIPNESGDIKSNTVIKIRLLENGQESTEITISDLYREYVQKYNELRKKDFGPSFFKTNFVLNQTGDDAEKLCEAWKHVTNSSNKKQRSYRAFEAVMKNYFDDKKSSVQGITDGEPSQSSSNRY
ncbi:MAG: hypothetical protein A3E82_02645 [Gammaproteobacteria bacterium RIFCSPHIGHO2_12_FULL_38_11]|nr:MAG: hypothetical protein A3E82_02645 [Gammaproteobacteria bacterium RIFCSPHIGHO2_12_FULL_38_11]